MKAFLAVVVLALAMGVVLAGTNAMAPAAAAHKTHQVKAEVVSMDAKAKTLTIKDETGATKTVPVLGNAEAKLKNVKAGEQVVLTCQDDDKGEHQGITMIKPAAQHAAKK